MKKANCLKVILILITTVLSTIPIQASPITHIKPIHNVQECEDLEKIQSAIQ